MLTAYIEIRFKQLGERTDEINASIVNGLLQRSLACLAIGSRTKKCVLRDLHCVIVQSIKSKKEFINFAPRLSCVVFKSLRKFPRSRFLDCGKFGDIWERKCVKFSFVEGLPVESSATAGHQTKISK